MNKTLRPIAYVLASTSHGSLIVNRHDYRLTDNGGYGVGYQLLNTSAFDPDEVDFCVQLLMTRRQHFGDGVVIIDCGANIGVHTIEWAKAMHGWGEVIAVEAQERVFYALAGNIALNNCFNARAILAAIGAQDGEVLVPVPDYLQPSSFGSLEIRNSISNEYIGQKIDYSAERCERVRMLTIDQLELKRLDFIKIDIEGMEMEALTGARCSIEKYMPQMLIEKIKSDEQAIRKYLGNLGYTFFSLGINLLAVHASDPAAAQISVG